MRHHPVFKAIAIILSAVMISVLCISSLCFWFLLEGNLYTINMDELTGRLKDYRAETLASNLVKRYANNTFSNVPDAVLSDLQGSQDDARFSTYANVAPDSWTYEIRDCDGVLLESNTQNHQSPATVFYDYTASYFMLSDAENAGFIHHSRGVDYYIREVSSPPYQVSIYMEDTAITAAYGLGIETIRSLYNLRYYILAVMAASILICLGCLIYLCFAAGHSKHREALLPGGLNRIPLDLYLPAVLGCCQFLIMAIARMSPAYHMYYHAGNTLDNDLYLKLILSIAFSFAGGLMGTGLVFATAAQWKAPDYFWLKNTVIFRILSVVFRLLMKAMQILPVMWLWLLTGICMGVAVVGSIILESEFLLFCSCLGCIAMIVYGAWCFGTLLQGAKKMAEGNLQTKIPEKFMFGSFRSLAQQMNALADVTVAAANAQLRSERMKTELITNVSHDIKTPLTSIINYTDLLRSAETPEQQADYLAVLDNQSQRLKKLIEDLTELSKASTGNLQANTAPMDAVEALQQALGEFADKMELAQLQVCPEIPTAPVIISADGRLFWRVAANLLSNAVKYALPGTRVYVSLKKAENFAVISVKNISREQLNISAEELMERFVRGDASRNTEGSGLGLSIAASLMEVQKGKLKLEINGDLFSATLFFPLTGEQSLV